jgi:hypothetical protein
VDPKRRTFGSAVNLREDSFINEQYVSVSPSSRIIFFPEQGHVSPVAAKGEISRCNPDTVLTAMHGSQTVDIFGSIWGTGCVLYIFVKAVLPVALEPFQEGATSLSQFELG